MIYPWQECYRDAVLEVDPRKLAHKIKLAEEVILQRLKELSAGLRLGGSERTSLTDSLSGLMVLRLEANHDRAAPAIE
jgi:hypothetical protein